MEAAETRILRGMYFKNGVPVGYVEVLWPRGEKGGRMEVGFNLYYTFRQGETAWLYARLLKLFRERFRVASFFIDPYQLGHENEEAIESGSFWFYYKLGFRPESQMARRAGVQRSPPTRLSHRARDVAETGGAMI